MRAHKRPLEGLRIWSSMYEHAYCIGIA